MTTANATLDQGLAADISDRAFRLYCVLVLRSNGEWMTIPRLARQCKLTPHQARGPVTELHAVGLLERKLRYETHQGRRSKVTYFRLANDAPGEAWISGPDDQPASHEEGQTA
ncbi:hypothetical protein [Streptomyces sp. CL12-4]|uniref:hypothetical protein n=1 Tax=Streptomyces sp. CL12-4 TaxID=2810306 RepID=UPI001EFC1CB3|nr:hypothetical protein [Streptomyces sp. CL12-4]MCG8971727.1 hypothetical protein [Streptomyces sp. CL12-4]